MKFGKLFVLASVALASLTSAHIESAYGSQSFDAESVDVHAQASMPEVQTLSGLTKKYVIQCEDAPCTEVERKTSTCTAVSCLKKAGDKTYTLTECLIAKATGSAKNCAQAKCVEEKECKKKAKTCNCAKYFVKCKKPSCPSGGSGTRDLAGGTCTPVKCFQSTNQEECNKAAAEKEQKGVCESATCELTCTEKSCDCPELTNMRTVLKECTPNPVENGAGTVVPVPEPTCQKKVKCEVVTKEACLAAKQANPNTVSCEKDEPCTCSGGGDSGPSIATDDGCIEWHDCDKVYGFTQASCCSAKCGPGDKYQKCVELERNPDTCAVIENPPFSVADFGKCQTIIASGANSAQDGGAGSTCDKAKADAGACKKLTCKKDGSCKKKTVGPCLPDVEPVGVTGNTGNDVCKKTITCVDCAGSVTNPSCDVVEASVPGVQTTTGNDCVADCEGTTVPCTCDGGPSKACLLCKWKECQGANCCKNGINKKTCMCKKATAEVESSLVSPWQGYKELPFAFCAALKIEGTEHACQRCGPCKPEECGWAGEGLDDSKAD